MKSYMPHVGRGGTNRGTHTIHPHAPVTRGVTFHPKVHVSKSPRRPMRPKQTGPAAGGAVRNLTMTVHDVLKKHL